MRIIFLTLFTFLALPAFAFYPKTGERFKELQSIGWVQTGKAYDCGESFNVLQMSKENKLGYYTYEIEDDIFRRRIEVFFDPDIEGDIKTVGSVMKLGGSFYQLTKDKVVLQKTRSHRTHDSVDNIYYYTITCSPVGISFPSDPPPFP